jgi:Skp family chaperone for outer membrane proteins
VKTLKSLLAAAALFSAGTAAMAQAAAKIVVVDTGKLLRESVEGKKTLDALEKLYSEEQNKFKSMKDEIDAMAADLQKKSDALSPEARAEQEEAIKLKAGKFERAYQSTAQNLENAKGKALAGYEEKLKAFLDGWGRRKAFTLLLDASVAHYYDPSLDVTAAALKDLNEAYIAAGQPEPKIEYGAAAPAPRPTPKSGTAAPKKP